MLKKRIAVAALTLGLSLPALSSAAPLSWVPRLDVLAKVTRLWSLLPGRSSEPVAASARNHRKNGAGADPTGAPLPPGPGTQSIAPPDPPVTGR
jgi:hypothetical protein